MLCLAQQKEEKGRAYMEDALIAGKGLGEDRTNGAAARPGVAAREARVREERIRVKGNCSRNRGRR